MKRGIGVQTAHVMNIHPSTVSRNKERSDVVGASKKVELLTNLNKNDIRNTDGNDRNFTDGK